MKAEGVGRRSVVKLLAWTVAGTGLAACANSPADTRGRDDGSATETGTPGGESPAPDQPQDNQSTEASSVNVDSALVAGYSTVTLAVGEGVSAVTPRFATARNLSQACEIVRDRFLRGARWVDAKKVDISASFVACSADVVGVQFTSTVDGRTDYAMLWYDARKSQTFSSPELIEPYGWGNFAQAVHDAATEKGLDAAKVDEALIARQAPYGPGPGMYFESDGRLRITFNSGVLGDAPHSLTLDANDWLSEFGSLAQSAATSPVEFTGKPSRKETHFTPGKERPAPISSPNAPSDGDTHDKLPKPKPGGKVRPSTAVGYDPIVEPCVALTYDDGPGPRTPELLSILDKAKVTATFFALGNSIKSYPDTVKRMARSGYEVASHTITHADLAKQSVEKIQTEVNGNSELIAQTTGYAPLLFRPPYGSHNEKVDNILTEAELAVVMWSVDTNDWKHRNTGQTVAKSVGEGMKFTQPIVLMHDIHDSTIDAAQPIVQQLTEKNFHLVSVSELTVNTGGLFAGHSYCRGTGILQEGFGCKG